MHSEMQVQELETASSNAQHQEDKVVGHGGNTEADRAFNFALQHRNLTWTPEEERRVLLKIDLWILPLTFVAGLLTYADSGAYGVAALFGMVKDLRLYDIVSLEPVVLSLTKYSWTSSIATFGNMVFLFPILLLAQRLPPGKLYSFFTFYSGIFALLMLSARDFAGAMVIRFFYGVQIVVVPLFVVYCSTWYTQKEQPLRIGLMATGSAFGSLMGQGIDFAAVNIRGAFAASPWKWMYVILGSITVAWGVLYFILVPDTPTKARFLNERETAIAIERVRRNGTGMQSAKFEVNHAIKALFDPQLWALIYVSFALQFAGSAVGTFGGLLTSSFGYEGKKALVFLMPASAVAVIVILLSGALATFFPKTRILIAISCLVVTIVGNLLLYKSPRSNKAALLAGLYLSVFFYGATVQLYAILSSNIGGNTKKTVVTSGVFILSSAGGIVAPFAYKGQEQARGFPTGIITVLVLMATAVFVLIALRISYVRYNKKADAAMVTRGIAAVEVQEEVSPESGFGDVSERDVPHFRYQI